MKHFFCAFAFLLWACNLQGQKHYKNEIGIGIGTIEYSFAHNDFGLRSNRLLFNRVSFAKESNPFMWSGGSGSITTQSYALPAIYYTRILSRHLSFLLSFQYAKARGILYEYWGGSPDHSNRFFNINNYSVQFGYELYILSKKRLHPCVGLGFNLEAYQSKSSTYYMFSLVEKFQNLEGTLSPYLSAGANFNLSKRFSLKYNASLNTDLDLLYFRPINRLSINFQF